MDARVKSPSNYQLLARYETHYGVAGLTLDQVWRHLALERKLTAELLASSRTERWDVFERCYGELYRDLPWLAGTSGAVDPRPWMNILGPPPQRIYEVGSGAGRLAQALADLGYDVEATDVARERGGERPASKRLTWSTCDGVNLARYARRGDYDAVISDQLIEHLHPEDIEAHFSGCRAILRPGGKYMFRTPHAYTGPHDVSLLFGFERPVGMHLHEYTNGELVSALKSVGFEAVAAVVYMPRWRAAIASRLILAYLIALETGAERLSRRWQKHLAARLRGPLSLRIFLVAS
jgi:2-polyprenyl-3-methyl-5-hydroxy-6-metoxy-1,4-benzoquinol methylase